MLETVREYALERLRDRGEYDVVHKAMADYLIARGEAAEQLSEELGSPRDAADHARLIRDMAPDLDNVRVAMAWALNHQDTEVALRLARVSEWFAEGTGWFRSEQRDWLERALTLPGVAPPRARARALSAAADNAFMMGDQEAAERLGAEALSLYRELGAEVQLVALLGGMGTIAHAAGHNDLARARFEESLDLAQRISDRHRVHRAMHSLGELEKAEENFDQAAALFERSADLAREVGDYWHLGAILHGWGDVTIAQGNHCRALDHYREALLLAQQLSMWRLTTHCVAGLAAAATYIDDPDRAGCLWGALDALGRQLGWNLLDVERHSYDRAIAACADRHPREFAAGFERGQGMNPNEIIDYALDAQATP